jgi:formiminotetrahydrofolate cyclodeaminase
MRALGDETLAAVTALVARPEPAPGGGACAAIACALGAALAAMAAALSKRTDRVDRLHQIRAEALTLADRDGAAYGAVIEAQRLQPGDERRERLADALSKAADVPLRIAELGVEVRELAIELERDGNPNLAGDAAVAAQLGIAAVTGAARLVVINLADRPADPRYQRAATLCSV